jgi:hypothetical protein
MHSQICPALCRCVRSHIRPALCRCVRSQIRPALCRCVRSQIRPAVCRGVRSQIRPSVCRGVGSQIRQGVRSEILILRRICQDIRDNINIRSNIHKIVSSLVKVAQVTSWNGSSAAKTPAAAGTAAPTKAAAAKADGEIVVAAAAETGAVAAENGNIQTGTAAVASQMKTTDMQGAAVYFCQHCSRGSICIGIAAVPVVYLYHYCSCGFSFLYQLLLVE